MTPEITAEPATDTKNPTALEQVTDVELNRAIGACRTLIDLHDLGIVAPILETKLHALLVDLHEQRSVRTQMRKTA